GGVISAVTLSIIRLPNRAGLTILVAIGLYGGCMLGFGLSTTIWLSLLFLALSGATDFVLVTLRHRVRNLLTPDPLRGRVASVHRMLSGGGPQLGEFEAGLLASLTSAGTAVAFGGIASVATAVIAAKLVPGITTFKLSQATLPEAEPAVSP